MLGGDGLWAAFLHGNDKGRQHGLDNLACIPRLKSGEVRASERHEWSCQDGEGREPTYKSCDKIISELVYDCMNYVI